MKEVILELIKNNKHQYRVLNNDYPKYCLDVLEFNKENSNISWSEKLYRYLYSDKINNVCECGKKTKFISINMGYKEFCSIKCGTKSKKTLNKRKMTNLERYGVENLSQNKEIVNKRKKTNLERYGVESYVKSLEFKEKTKNSFINKYGVDHYSKTQNFRKKIEKINNEKTDKERLDQLNKRKETNLNRYGVESFMSSNEFKEKSKKTNLKKYGVENVFQSKEIKKIIKKTNLEKYGVENVSSSKEIKNKSSLSKRNNIIIKWCKILDINIEDISLINSKYHIMKYCKNHQNGFEIDYDTLYNRIIQAKTTNICTICNPISNQSSIKENEIKNWLKSLNVSFEEKNRTILNGKELDIFIPNHNLAVEFNGLYWHSDQQKPNNYHLNKTELCKSKDIQLLHIFEDEWVYKSDIVKSIIKSKLGLIDNKIYGRKCEIKEVSSKDSSIFLDKNHIQGNVNTSIKIGLYYNNELVSLMTFGKKRVAMGSSSKDDEYEMYRFCNKLNTNIIGGASKLFKYFLENYKSNEVISYADRRYFDGGIYKKIGFNLDGVSKPNYFYIKKGELYRKHRFNFRKDVLIKEGYDSTKTEKQIMIERGYYRIYDSGNLKFKYDG